MRNKMWPELILCVSLLVLTTQIAGAIAYQTDNTSAKNQFVPGMNESEITEEFPDPSPIVPGDSHTVTKKIKITNKEGVPCFVRVCVKSANSDIPVTFLYEGEEGYHEEDWILGEDGYYYYKYVLEEGEDTSVLMDGVQIGNDSNFSEYWGNVSNLSVLVYAETVQAKNADTGTYWETFEDAWTYYLTKLKEEGMG